MRQGLGTQLRHLIELLDGAVQRAYTDAGLDYRPRYTPVMRVLIDRDTCTVGEVAAASRITQPAATQTVAQMVEDGLVVVRPGADDARQRILRLTRRGRDLVPHLQTCWRATDAAAAGLDADLSSPLSRILEEAVAALQMKPFGQRIAEARVDLTQGNIHESTKPVRSSPSSSSSRVRAHTGGEQRARRRRRS
ncbi:MAG TPA: MarR family transcriptional regulator [Polyangiaceae bacterium]|nr:MarR family transcriptional regulator [Polyangiaceae bacterium]